ncbi:MAG: AEC family transporter [Pseudomonadota bacterium]
MEITAFLVAIAPIFLLIVLGHVLRRGGIPNTEFWNLNDKLVYWVLMPALLFYKTSTIEISLDLATSYAVVILGGFGLAFLFGLLAARLSGVGNAAGSSIIQGASRHNAFIALSVAEALFGAEGLALAALATAMLIPVTNLTIVPTMVIMNQSREHGGLFGAILKDLGRNPLILSVGAGLTVNLTGVGEIPVLHDTAGLIGAAALPIVLMCVGANLRLRAMQTRILPLILASIGKFAVFPTAVFLLAQWIGLTPLETFIALLFGASPTASAAYTLARQLGGDAPLMAAITTIQTALAFLLLPMTIQLAQIWLG